jgi:hypothetical protein
MGISGARSRRAAVEARFVVRRTLMPRAVYTTVLNHKADEIWAVIRLFDQYAWAGVGWTTIIENEQAGDQVAIRRIVMADGVVRRQILLAHSDLARSYTYSICDPPYLPIGL